MEHNTELSYPKTPRQYARLYFSGFAMGASDIVPGVSGGTMAFILGVYENLIDGIKSFDLTAIRLALKFDFKALFMHVPIRFLIALGLGIVTAIFALSSVLHDLLETQPTFVFAFFGGLILASILAVGIKVRWGLLPVIGLIAGAVFAFWLVGLPLLEDASHDPLTLMFSGAIAICAMILPGVSGSFILLILGQYEFVLGAVKSFDIVSIGAVGVGAVIGIIAFSRILSYLLKHHEHVTVAVLVGFMAGSLRRIWEEASAGTEIIEGFGAGHIGLAIALLIVGFLMVSLLDHLQSRSNPVIGLVWKRKVDAAPETEVAPAA